jgi:hypothetical protein
MNRVVYKQVELSSEKMLIYVHLFSKNKSRAQSLKLNPSLTRLLMSQTQT